MSCYINSNENRFYVGRETSYGQAAAVTPADRFPAVKLTARQISERAERRDKTGGRTFQGLPVGVRRSTSFGLTTYLTGWSDPSVPPGYGPLFEAAMGRTVKMSAGGTAGSGSTATRVQFAAPHGLEPGQAISFGGELRFAAAIVDGTTVQLNAPFTIIPGAGSPIGPTATYFPGKELPSVTLYDYWSPADAVQRLLSGAAMDTMTVRVNSDFHEFQFAGPAKDLVDSASFQSGEAGLTQFPLEPAMTLLNYGVIPGHLGQVWMGSAPDRFFTLTEASLKLDNDIDARFREFGADGPQCIMAGRRTVTVDFAVYEQDDAATRALYQAARQRSPVAAMFQLGEQPGQLFGAYVKGLALEVPEFNDGEPRLSWEFKNCRAQGTQDDELVVAFG